LLLKELCAAFCYWEWKNCLQYFVIKNERIVCGILLLKELCAVFCYWEWESCVRHFVLSVLGTSAAVCVRFLINSVHVILCVQYRHKFGKMTFKKFILSITVCYLSWIVTFHRRRFEVIVHKICASFFFFFFSVNLASLRIHVLSITHSRFEVIVHKICASFLWILQILILLLVFFKKAIKPYFFKFKVHKIVENVFTIQVVMQKWDWLS
jgi:hypothetical protein